jgi:hypothetical protein
LNSRTTTTTAAREDIYISTNSSYLARPLQIDPFSQDTEMCACL